MKQSPHILFDEMNRCHETGNHRTAVIVFKQSNFTKPYTELQRSYASHSDQWGWSSNLLGRQILGSCLDGTDQNIRLDHEDWEIEYWYWMDER